MVDRWMDGQVDRYSGQMRDRQIDTMNGQTDRYDEWVTRQIDGQIDIQD